METSFSIWILSIFGMAAKQHQSWSAPFATEFLISCQLSLRQQHWFLPPRYRIQTSCCRTGSASEDKQSSGVRGPVSYLWHVLLSICSASAWNPGWSHTSIRTLQRKAGEIILSKNWRQRIQQESPGVGLSLTTWQQADGCQLMWHMCRIFWCQRTLK